MIKILMGEKGTGKTKVLTDMVNKASANAEGMVVCINKGNRLTHDVDIGVRLVDTEEFNITNPDVFLGFIEGIVSQNFDITDIYIDGILKITGGDADGLIGFLKGLEGVSEKFSIEFVLSVSANPANVCDAVKKYCIEF